MKALTLDQEMLFAYCLLTLIPARNSVFTLELLFVHVCVSVCFLERKTDILHLIYSKSFKKRKWYAYTHTCKPYEIADI